MVVVRCVLRYHKRVRVHRYVMCVMLSNDVGSASRVAGGLCAVVHIQVVSTITEIRDSSKFGGRMIRRFEPMKKFVPTRP